MHLEFHHLPPGAAGVADTVGCGVLLGLTPTGVCGILGIPALRATLGSPPTSPWYLPHEEFATANWILECCDSNTKQITSWEDIVSTVNGLNAD